MSDAAPVSWQFTSAIAPDRASRLLTWQSFEAIVECISKCAIAPLYWEAAIAPRLKDCKRASFELTVDADIYDAFFNSPAGYCGQFARSEGNGELANRLLFDRLVPRLIEVAAGHPSAPAAHVMTSLGGEQAKVWIDETEVEPQLSDPASHIVFAPWAFNEPDGPGLRAPRGTKLGVKGGWVTPAGAEVINNVKKKRSGHINRTGDSK